MNLLPAFCYAFVLSNGPGKYVVAIKRGEKGCFTTTYDTLDSEEAKRIVSIMNHKLDVNAPQAEAMVNGSMFGWDTPSACPDQLVLIPTGKTEIGAYLLSNLAKTAGMSIVEFYCKCELQDEFLMDTVSQTDPVDREIMASSGEEKSGLINLRLRHPQSLAIPY